MSDRVEGDVEGKCHCCNDKTDWVCEHCDQWVCESCTMPFTQMTEIDYTLCWSCNDMYEEERANEMIEEERVDNLIKELTYDGYLVHEELTKQLKK